jgi:hypothetical protein
MSIRQVSPSCPQRLKFTDEAKFLRLVLIRFSNFTTDPILGTIRCSAENVAVVNRIEALGSSAAEQFATLRRTIWSLLSPGPELSIFAISATDERDGCTNIAG